MDQTVGALWARDKRVLKKDGFTPGVGKKKESFKLLGGFTLKRQQKRLEQGKQLYG